MHIHSPSFKFQKLQTDSTPALVKYQVAEVQQKLQFYDALIQ